MIRKLGNLLLGEVRFHFESAFPERVLNLCAARGLPFWNVRWLSATELCFTLSWQDSRRLSRAARQLPGRLSVAGRKGVPFLAGRLRRRTVLLCAGAACGALLLLASCFIWEFQVEGNRQVAEEEILRALAEQGVTIGSFGGSINSTKLRNRLLLRLPQLSYIAVNVRGCVAHVQVRERVNPPRLVDKTQAANVVASKAGLVTRVEAWDGYAAVLPGTTVTKGQLLISGVTDLENQGVLWMHGMGRVYARTWYDLAVQVPLQRQEKQYSGRESRRWALLVGGSRIKFYGNSSITPALCDKIVKTKHLSLLGVALPLRWETEICRFYTLQSAAVGEEEARQEGEAQLLAQLQERLGNDGSVTSTRFAAVRRGSWLLVTLSAECLEQIGETVPIQIETQS